MTSASQSSHDENGQVLKPCDGCGESYSASRLLPIWDGSIQVCEKCYAAAIAMLSTEEKTRS
jgi:hypothetical protein